MWFSHKAFVTLWSWVLVLELQLFVRIMRSWAAFIIVTLGIRTCSNFMNSPHYEAFFISLSELDKFHKNLGRHLHSYQWNPEFWMQRLQGGFCNLKNICSQGNRTKKRNLLVFCSTFLGIFLTIEKFFKCIVRGIAF